MLLRRNILGPAGVLALAAMLTLSASALAAEGEKNPLAPDITFPFQLVIFLLAVAVFNFFVYRPVRRVLTEREKGTTGTGSEAEDLRAEAERLRADYEAKLRAARDQGASERSRLRTEGQEKQNELVEQAREESEQIIEKLTADIRSEYETARKTLQQQARTLSEQMVSKLLERSV